jgi:Na+/H+ antiporter NhaD/arsenite permease-like protein
VHAHEAVPLGAILPIWSAVPFAGMLLSIALFPLLAPALWHKHFPKITAAWALVFAVPFVAIYGGRAAHNLVEVALSDYVPFLILIATLFTVGGGIYVRGTLRGTPGTNASILLVGTLLASWVGTTGAAMVFIRPLLRANRTRRYRTHSVVFFIFLVANIGGALTPLGDPPLFLGFLHGVPFTWTLSLWRETATAAALVLAAYLIVETIQWRRESPAVRSFETESEPLRIEGTANIVLLLGVIAAVIASGSLELGEIHVAGVAMQTAGLMRDLGLAALLAASWKITPRHVRTANEFSWHPIREVAILFAGIFVTMIPAIAMLRAGEEGAMRALVHAVSSPSHFFWASGTLSSFLDNAPTYLTFVSTVLGRLYPGMAVDEAVPLLIRDHAIFLEAVSLGSVFMGAVTYIGNAPNFMVKSIAEEAGVPMPSFFGYVLRYSLVFLIPVFALITVWFF